MEYTVEQLDSIIKDLKRQLSLLPSLRTDYFSEDYIQHCKKLTNAIEYLEMKRSKAIVSIDSTHKSLESLEIKVDS